MLRTDRKPIAINGKFLGAKATGVHRVAKALLRQVDLRRDELTELFGAEPYVIAPRNVVSLPEGIRLRLDNKSLLTGQLWEQFELPWRSRHAVLLGFCNLAPLLSAPLGGEAITMFHDAQVWTTPESYSWAFRQFYRQVQPKVGASARRILTVSHFSAQQLAQFGMAPAERIRVIHNGIDHAGAASGDGAILAKLGLEPGNYVLALSNVQVHKNIGVLLRAFEGGACAPLKLVLFGGATAADFVAAGSPVGPDVVFAGRVSDTELSALMAAALCFAMPSTTEGFGLPPLEAMSQGCPAVIAPCGALPEVCEGAALEASADDPQAWVDAFTRLRDQPDLRARMIEAGLTQAGRFTWDAAGDALMQVLREVRAELA